MALPSTISLPQPTPGPKGQLEPSLIATAADRGELSTRLATLQDGLEAWTLELEELEGIDTSEFTEQELEEHEEAIAKAEKAVQLWSAQFNRLRGILAASNTTKANLVEAEWATRTALAELPEPPEDDPAPEDPQEGNP